MVYTSTGSICPLCLRGQHTGPLTITVALETIVSLVAVLAVEVSLMSCHGGAVREERRGEVGERRGERREERREERRGERRGEGEEGRIMYSSLYSTIMLKRRKREEREGGREER